MVKMLRQPVNAGVKPKWAKYKKLEQNFTCTTRFLSA